jgi:hypothetical protein
MLLSCSLGFDALVVVFSFTESFGSKLESVAESNSGGGASFPTAGISFAIVLVVFVRCGFKDFSCCLFLYSSVVSFARLLRAFKSVEGVLFPLGFPRSLSEAKRGIAEENARVFWLENVRRARDERSGS